jgi:triphosphoribosyl-dephospho-CoA synthetase
LAFAQESARAFLAGGGALVTGWQARLSVIAMDFVARNLSPGGSADLLACAWFGDRYAHLLLGGGDKLKSAALKQIIAKTANA